MAGALCIGYYSAGSHALVGIPACPVLRPELQQLLAALYKFLPGLPSSKCITGAQATLTADGIGVTLEIIGTASVKLLEALPIFATNCAIARLSLKQDGRIEPIYAPFPLTVRMGNFAIPFPAGGFLQATAEAQEAITHMLGAHLKGCKKIVDLFSGLGTYSFPLLATASVLAVEGDATLVASFTAAARHQPHASRLRAECRDLFRNPYTANELIAFTGAAINPPRAGAKAQCEALAKSGIERIAMVSCNPETAARDLSILRKGGYKITAITGIDQFIYSEHVELVATLIRPRR